MDDELETERTQVLVCEECGCDSDDDALGWEAHLGREDDGSTTVAILGPSARWRSDPAGMDRLVMRGGRSPDPRVAGVLASDPDAGDTSLVEADAIRILRCPA